MAPREHKKEDRQMDETTVCVQGTLTDEERAEYESFVEGNDMLMLLKEQARSVLQHD